MIQQFQFAFWQFFTLLRIFLLSFYDSYVYNVNVKAELNLGAMNELQPVANSRSR